jgi:DNA-binding NarL/FixJ family response regulator
MAGGSSNQGIADKLVITLRAVEKYVSSIFASSAGDGVHDRVHMRRRGAIEPK